MKKDKNETKIIEEMQKDPRFDKMRPDEKKELIDFAFKKDEFEKIQSKAAILNTQEDGFLNKNISQEEMLKYVSVIDREKQFDLEMRYGPYCLDFSRDGKILAVGGEKGHVGSCDYLFKNIKFDLKDNLESVYNIKFLHKNNRIAAAQEKYLYIYGDDGIEMHCIRSIPQPRFLQFLPYHYVLACGMDNGYLGFVDIAIGESIISYPTYLGPISMMCQNPTDATIATGHMVGTVNFWTPNHVKKPVMKIIVNRTDLNDIDIDFSGRYLAIAGSDKKIKVFDIRMAQTSSNKPNPVAKFISGTGIPTSINFSQKGLLAVSANHHIRIYKDLTQSNVKDPVPHLTHDLTKGSVVKELKFCPYEDVLGIGLNTGISTMLVPGSAYAEYNAYDANAGVSSTRFKQNDEIKKLLRRIPPELIKLGENGLNCANTQLIDEKDFEIEKKKMYGYRDDFVLTKKKSKQKKPKKVNTKRMQIKDNIHYERIVQKRKLTEMDKTVTKKTKEVKTALDNLK